MSVTRYQHVFREPTRNDPRTLVCLHGTGGSAREFARIGAMVAPQAAVLAVDGNVIEDGMARFFRRFGEGRYDMEDLARRTGELDGFLAAALADYGRDPAQTIGIGYSNGANILANLLFTNPGRLGRYALMHPLIPFEPAPNPRIAGTRVLITAGERDPICPLPMTVHLSEWLREQRADVVRATHRGGHEIQQQEIERIAGWLEQLEAVA